MPSPSLVYYFQIIFGINFQLENDDEVDDDENLLFAAIRRIPTKTEPQDDDDDDREPENDPDPEEKEGGLGRNARKLMREMRMKSMEEERKRREDLENRNRPRRRKKVDMTPEEKELHKEGIISVTHPLFIT